MPDNNDKPGIEGEVIRDEPHAGLLKEFGKTVERDLIQRLTPIDGEVVKHDTVHQVPSVIEGAGITRENDTEGDLILKLRIPTHWDGTLDLHAIIKNADRRKRGNVIEGELAEPTPKEQGLAFMLAAMKRAHRTPRRPILEGEVVTPADEEKLLSDVQAVIFDTGIALMPSGGYVALPPVWSGGIIEKEVKDITPLQIEKKD